MKAFFRDIITQHVASVCPGWNIEIKTRKIVIFIYGLQETRENGKKQIKRENKIRHGHGKPIVGIVKPYRGVGAFPRRKSSGQRGREKIKYEEDYGRRERRGRGDKTAAESAVLRTLHRDKAFSSR